MTRAPSPRSGLFDLSSPAGEEIERRLAVGASDRRRTAELHLRFRERLDAAAKARGDDPYRLLAEAIRRMLRE